MLAAVTKGRQIRTFLLALLLPGWFIDRFLLGLHREYGDAASFFLMGELFVAVFTPEAVVDVTVREQHAFIKGVGFDRIKILLGNGIIVSEGEFWKRQRRLAQPAFHLRRLKALAVTSAEPSALLPALPTVAAAGLPGYQAVTINGFFAPARTPATVVEKSVP